MKFYLLMIFMVLGLSSLEAQTTWPTFNSTRGSYSFKMPTQPAYYDTLTSALFHLEVGTQVFESHYADSARINYSLGEPYELFAQSLVYTTQGTLESANWVTQSNITGREIGISYSDHIDNVGNLRFLFVRIFFWNDQVLSFSISGYQSELPALLQSKTSFFNSIIFN